ncbi:MAG: hypothetical protein CM15mP83_2030 [Flavobacteriaceae bacterium]|nr:MAG: hypothetical protein CM15mP83_2030 [Flavobacteriaceae bacterium]
MWASLLICILYFNLELKNHYGDDVHGNIFEALVGAVFVDGGFLKCRSFVETKSNPSLC